MRLKKFLLFGLMAAVLPAMAEEAADRKTATSLKYVEHELDTRQNKFTAESNKAMEYTNSAGDVQKRAVTSDLDNGGTDSLPMVGGVNTKLATKQDDIAAINDHTAVTYTGTSGKIGAKGIYQDTGTYIEQSDNLIDAKTFNAALKKGLDSEFLCSEYKPGTDLCWVWSIHNTEPVSVNLFDMSLIPTTQYIVHNADGSITVTTTATSSGMPSNRTLLQLAPRLQVGKTYKFSINTTGTTKQIYMAAPVNMIWNNGTSKTITQNMLNSTVLLYASGTSTSATISDIRITEVNPEMPFTTLVPAGYTPVEYIISNGTQYFDSGRKATEKSEVSVTAMATVSDSTKNRLIGNYADFSKAFTLNMSTTGGSSRFGNQVFAGIAMPIGSKHVFSNGVAGLRMDAEVLRAWTTQPAFETPGNVALLASTNTTTTVPSNLTNGLAGNTYNITWHEDGVLVMNLIPARRNQDSVVGMYDTVSNTFFENAGTGVFQAGPDINNIIYIPQGQ